MDQLGRVDVLVLTLGEKVQEGGTREALLPDNWQIFVKSVLPVLDASAFRGTVLVVTNPLDQLCYLLHRNSRLEPDRVLGLGTLVETARLRASLGARLSPARPARDILSYAVGTHDKQFIPVIEGAVALGATLSPAEIADIHDAIRDEVALGADRVKRDTLSTLLPVTEAVVRVVEALDSTAPTVLTVSVRERAPAGLWYSVPVALDRAGAGERHVDGLVAVKPDLENTRARLLRELAAI